jgi:hypothetical protein
VWLCYKICSDVNLAVFAHRNFFASHKEKLDDVSHTEKNEFLLKIKEVGRDKWWLLDYN